MATGRRPGRRPTIEESAALDEIIRKAAIEEFLERGFSGASMDGIARSAGVTRQTLYARYPDKAALFNQVIRSALLRSSRDVAPKHRPGEPLADSLMRIAKAAYARAVDPEATRLSVLLMAESPRFPKLVPKEHDVAKHPHMQSLVEVLREHQERGRLRVDDVALAAEQFLTMVASHPTLLSAFGFRKSPADERKYLRHAVDLFIAAVSAPEDDE